MNNTHPCANKCSEFKDGEQCHHCLINETPIQGVYLIHRTEHQINTNDMGDDTHIENHISPLIERLKAENVAMQARIDELESENKMLHEAAATHLRNQNHFKGLYDALVEQLYPYALDLEYPSIFLESEKSRFPKEYRDGYDRARECVHYNLLEMMESDEEYIRAQCGMLGGGSEA